MAETVTLRDENRGAEIYGFPVEQGQASAKALYEAIYQIDPNFKGTYQEALALQMSQNPEAPTPGNALDEIAPLPGDAPAPPSLDTVAPLPGTEATEPRTNITGLMGAATRGAAPAVVGAGAGALAGAGLTALGATSAAIPLLPILGAATMALGEPVTWIINKVFGTNYESPRESVGRLLTEMGVEEADSQAEMLVEQGVRTGADLVTVFGPVAQAGAQTMAAVQGNPLNPGTGQALLQQFGKIAGGPAVAGEVAEEFGAQRGAEFTRGVAESAGVQNPTALELAEIPGRIVGGGVLGGLTEGLAALRRGALDSISLRDARSRTPDDAGRSPYTRSELNPNDYMTTQRGQQFQSFSEGLVGGTGEFQFRRHWENVKELEGVLGAYGVELDDLGRVPDMSQPLLDDFLSTRGAELSEYTGLRDGVIDAVNLQVGDAPVPVPRTTRYLDQEFANVSRRDTAASRQLAAKIEEWKQALQGKDFEALNATRRDLRAELASDNNQIIRSEGTRILDEAYEIATRETGDFVEDSVGDTVARQWRTANQRLAELAGDLNDQALESIIAQGKLNPDNVTPEMILNRLTSQTPSDTAKVYRSLSEDGQAIARQAFISDMARSQDFNDLSPTRFARTVSERAEQLGILFDDDEVQTLIGMKKHFDITRRAEGVARAANRPQGLPTGALPGSGTLQSMAVRGHPTMGLITSIAGIAGLGRVSRYIENSPQIKRMFRELADLSPGSDSAMRLSRLITGALEDGLVEEEFDSPLPEGGGAPNTVRRVTPLDIRDPRER